MTATFPYLPDWGASPEMPQAINKITFGDGYEQRSHKGINPYLPTWSLSFSGRTQGEAQAIAAWFQANEADVVGFYWTSPDSTNTASSELFFTGDGATTSAQLTKNGIAVTNGVVISSITRTDWQGTQTLSLAARTNYCLQSQDLSTTWAKTTGVGTITTNAIAAPDGTTTADLYQENATTDIRQLHQTFTGLTDGADYCLSCHVKDSGVGKVAIQIMQKSGVIPLAQFDLTTGAITSLMPGYTSAGMKLLSNGWWRIWMAANTLTGASTPRFALRLARLAGNASYLGDGSSGAYLWGAQLEPGTSPTAYIGPTTTAAVTVTDCSVSATGLVTFGQTPVSGALLKWTGTYTSWLKWVADSWSPAKPDAYNSWSITATFRQVAA